MPYDNDKNFPSLADDILEKIAERIESSDLEGSFDAELSDGILKIQKGEYICIINKHSAAREIWSASLISGPNHFAYNGSGRWISKSGKDLLNLLEEELKIKF